MANFTIYKNDDITKQITYIADDTCTIEKYDKQTYNKHGKEDSLTFCPEKTLF